MLLPSTSEALLRLPSEEAAMVVVCGEEGAKEEIRGKKRGKAMARAAMQDEKDGKNDWQMRRCLQ